jgi:hypothetical protein
MADIERILESLSPADRERIDFDALSQDPEYQGLPEARKRVLGERYFPPAYQETPTEIEPPTDPTAAFVRRHAPMVAATLMPAPVAQAGIAAIPLRGVGGAALRGGARAAFGAGTELGREAVSGEPISPVSTAVAAGTELLGGVAPAVQKGVGGVKALLARRASKVAEAELGAAQAARQIPGQVPEIVPRFAETTPKVGAAYQAAEEAAAAAPEAARQIPMTRTAPAIEETLERFPEESGSAAFDALRDASTRLKRFITQPPGTADWRMAIDDFQDQAQVLWQRVMELPKGPAKQQLKRLYGEMSEDLSSAAAQAKGAPAALLKRARDSNVAHLVSDKLREIIAEGLPTDVSALTEGRLTALARTIRKNADLKRHLGPEGLDAVVGRLQNIRLGVPKPLPRGRPIEEAALTGAGAVWRGPVGAALGAAIGPFRNLTPELIRESLKVETTPLARLITSGVLHGLRRSAMEEPERGERPGSEALAP